MNARRRPGRMRMVQRQRMTLRRVPVIISVFIVTATTGITIFLNIGKQEKALASIAGSAITSGNWNSASSWSFNGVNRIPTCGDTVTIPVLKTITVNNQENLRGCASPLVIKVYGVLQFTNGNKLDLPCNSIVYIMPGGVIKKSTAGGGSSTLISICSTTLWTAGDGPLPGPDTLFVPATTLPIKLMYFDADANDNGVNLSWATANEVNNDFFTIEKSTDGVNFKMVSTKNGAGNSTSNIYYSDKDVHPESGYSYYRLKQTDYDGHYSYSEIKTVKYGKSSEHEPEKLEIKSLAPNPFTENFKLTFIMNTASVVDFMLISSTGQVVSQEKIQAEEGMNTYEYRSQGNLDKGIYYVTVTSNGERTTEKIIRN